MGKVTKPQRDNSGILFKNDRKEKPNHPDYRGTANINGEERKIAAWIKKDRNGDQFVSLAFEDPNAAPATSSGAQQVQAPGLKPAQISSEDDMDEGIPF